MTRFKGLFYSSEEALLGLWFEKARAKGTYKVKVCYDPRDMGAILVEEPKSKDMIQCGLVDWESKYAGKQLGEVSYEQEKEKSEKKRNKVRETEAKVNLGKQIESIVDSAESMTGTDKTASKSERIRNIRSNRRNEREEIRKQESFVKEVNDKNNSDIVIEAKQPEMSPVMRMIQRQVEDEIRDDALYSESRIPEPDHS